ncbi:hypothetical protein C8Q75DRAFT_462398 [Abortiporus biennis]|nr:hypothetical protein C8Q75DRAFT_462398 [Abortiporus biennis]
MDMNDDTRGRSEFETGEGEQRGRYNAIIKWCEGHGPIRKIERKNDNSIDVHWKDWETADRVCRIQKQVFIKEAGTVSIAWHYLK